MEALALAVEGGSIELAAISFRVDDTGSSRLPDRCCRSLGFKHLAVAERIQSSGAKIEKARDLTAGQISCALTDLSNQQQ
jgi:hypothetical protein